MEGSRDNFLLMCLGKRVESDRVAGYSDRQVRVFVRIFVSILQKRSVEHVDVQMMRASLEVALQKTCQHVRSFVRVLAERFRRDGEGVGLFRTEFLYMESAELPTEEQQFEVYKEVLEGMEGKPVVVRTLDIGGDKEIEAIDLPKEMNPFLGVRAIRLCFQREDIFRTQLRALLRASVYGDLRIMFPMIATLQEFRKAKGILMEEKEKLVAEGVKVSDTLQVGIMIEIPAAAVLAHKFAKEVDFFSVGTNDLVQYTFAADRMSSGVSYLYQPFNPSILNLLKHVIDSAHAEGKWAGMCGEMAGEAIAAPLLLGLGLDEFSMSATSILAQRKLIKSVSKADMETLVEKALDCATSEEVVELVKSTVKM